MEITGLDKIRHISKLGYVAIRRPSISRSKTTVLSEYESGWQSYESVLEKCDSLESWLHLNQTERSPIVCNLNGKLSFTDYNMSEFNRNALLDCIHNQFKIISSITEFGSGLGLNLLTIKSRFPHIQCYGYELCENGVKVAREAAKKFGIDVEYSQLDFINDTEDKYVFPKTDIAFTMYALEQIPSKSDIAIAHILKHVTQGSIHIEPVVENYPFTIRGFLGRLEHWKVDYLRNFESNLKQIPNIQFHKKQLNTSHNPLMFPSMYCVKKL